MIHDAIFATYVIIIYYSFQVFPYWLTNYHGNPFFALFGYDYLNVMMARAENKIEDMLFIGGDFNNQGFTAWKRID